MSTLVLKVQPTGVETHFVTAYILDRKRYVFEFYTNSVDSAWYYDVSNGDGSARARGLPLAVGSNLLFNYRALDLPQGTLQIDDVDLGGSDPDLTAFAEGRAVLLYTEVE